MHDMHAELGAIDLNLLLVFDAIAETGQVTAAAARLGLTQSAASHALRRLRDTLDDPLFVRGSDGLVPTPRAQALAPTVRGVLSELRRALVHHGTFVPATSEREVRIGAEDGFDITILPPLLEQLARIAPRMQLAVLRPDVGALAERLERGDYDLYFGVLPNRTLFAGLLPDPGSKALRTTAVFEEHWVCVVRRGHPRIRRAPSVAAYADESHVLFSPTGSGPGIVDRMLEAQGRSRRVILRVASFHSALAAVARSDAIWTGPARIAATLDPDRELLHVRAPLELPSYSTHLVWHERFDADAGHRWVRARILDAERAGRP